MDAKPLPIILRKFIFREDISPQHASYIDQDIDREQENTPVRLIRLEAPDIPQVSIPGYFVMSSAPPNIENAQELRKSEVTAAAAGVKEIARHLYRLYQAEGPAPELIIAVHGYNSSRGSVRDWYKTIFRYINRHDSAIPAPGNQVFIGYRWPSESIELERLGEAFWALPPLPRDLLLTGLAGGLALLILELTAFRDTLAGVVVAVLLALLLGGATTIVTLIGLRMVVYFRDRYRAQNFGVLDLVELLRQIDREMLNLKAEDLGQSYSDGGSPCADELDSYDAAIKFWQRAQRKVKLSFLGHSMGGFVVTNVVRILSDVFDSRSIDNQPPPDVGSVFQLERLMLTSPDIPVLAIVSSRTNFLSSSLRRFAESYLFSNEGDLALRVASATANYFMFPSSSEEMGYRLGNVALKSHDSDTQKFGIVNLNILDEYFGYDGSSVAEAISRSPYKITEHLFLTYNGFRKKGFNTLAKLMQQHMAVSQSNHSAETVVQPKMTIADFFTYFDCTDYRDVTFSLDSPSETRTRGLLTRAHRKKALGWWDYLMLSVDSVLQKRDVHGGYFQGEFTQEMIYRIAFLGFTDYLKTLHDDPNTAFGAHAALSKLHMRCRELGIQSFLSPIRYRVTIHGEDVQHNKQELLDGIDQETAGMIHSEKMINSLKNQGFDIVENK
ncbi:MAG: alpha/beta hydrolase [Cyanobacteria bacterium J06642_11]